MPDRDSISRRFPCPCCGFPTIDDLARYDICEICSWEDDGQSDLDADAITGGPIGDYSLTEARRNFLSSGVMFRPGHRPLLGGADTEHETALKSRLTLAFSALRRISEGTPRP
jgi:hypothetical protein